jgi:hypothetical protein
MLSYPFQPAFSILSSHALFNFFHLSLSSFPGHAFLYFPAKICHPFQSEFTVFPARL